FADSTAAKATIGTLTVAAPYSVTVTDGCRGWRYTATVSWPASTTPRGDTGYRVMAHLNTGKSVVLGETDASTLSISITVSRSYLNYRPRVSVITLTSYGWTAETPRSAVLTC
ncbi:hypothetical protein ACQ1ZK_14850, partial [Enterococcus faecium]